MKPELLIETPVFDSERPINVTLITSTGTKKVAVKFLSDQQIERRQRGRKVIIKDLGRGATDTDIQPNEEIDQQLLSEIQDGGEEIDGAEAIYVLDVISEAETVDVVREGPAYRVLLKVPGATTEHVVTIPTQRQIMDHRRQGTRVIGLPFGRREVRISFSASADLYDKLCKEREGYADGSRVPISHKAAAINSAITALEREIAGESEDSGF